jgi:hypothetical protein
MPEPKILDSDGVQLAKGMRVVGHYEAVGTVISVGGEVGRFGREISVEHSRGVTAYTAIEGEPNTYRCFALKAVLKRRSRET